MELNEILQKGYELATKTGEFIIEEGTILIQQFILYKTIEQGLVVLIGIFFMIGVPLIIRKSMSKAINNKNYRSIFLGKKTMVYEESPQYFLSCVGVLLSFSGGMITFFCGLFPFIKVLVAPNVYLLEYVLK